MSPIKFVTPVTALLRLCYGSDPKITQCFQRLLRCYGSSVLHTRPLGLSNPPRKSQTFKNSMRFKVLQGFSRVLKVKNCLALNHGKCRPDQAMNNFWTVPLGMGTIRRYSELIGVKNEAITPSTPTFHA